MMPPAWCRKADITKAVMRWMVWEVREWRGMEKRFVKASPAPTKNYKN